LGTAHPRQILEFAEVLAEDGVVHQFLLAAERPTITQPAFPAEFGIRVVHGLSETQAGLSGAFGTVMRAVVIPLTAVTLLLSLLATLKRRRA
jgi:hypothetical protein